ncbi:Hypothetical Protein FCC1311_107292 [Hondaea fermentalgiana]|uniref:Uncharacterized protein n=1 Tax=Hondaea fermentalgiana TaxID=2315210 RepID=A0A2R5GVB4_9STRA|nr:Hypothetical Protein FCC1311_107292 [Hondaea fermentalgiana]|eukprot:GBG34505.1 Hypothetical Protein FCC1311_107292 [Hondaea fermentalgiana]
MTKFTSFLLIAICAFLCNSAQATSTGKELLQGEARELAWYDCPANSEAKRRRPRRFAHCRCMQGFERDEEREACFRTVYLTVNNLSYMQPFSPFLVVVHNHYAPKLFVPGMPGPEGLGAIAEAGNTTMLEHVYSMDDNVLESFVGTNVPANANGTIEIRMNSDYPLVTIAAMCVNSNDCFVALNGAPIYNGAMYYEPAWDAGTEMNNELCTHVPGPACAAGTGNARTEMGEGFVHVHRGFQGINVGRTDLTEDELGANGEPLGSMYDWRNPIMLVSMSDAMM